MLNLWCSSICQQRQTTTTSSSSRKFVTIIIIKVKGFFVCLLCVCTLVCLLLLQLCHALFAPPLVDSSVLLIVKTTTSRCWVALWRSRARSLQIVAFPFSFQIFSFSSRVVCTVGSSIFLSFFSSSAVQNIVQTFALRAIEFFLEFVERVQFHLLHARRRPFLFRFYVKPNGMAVGKLCVWTVPEIVFFLFL